MYFIPVMEKAVFSAVITPVFFAHVFVKTVFSLNIKFKRKAFVSNINFLYSSFLM